MLKSTVFRNDLFSERCVIGKLLGRTGMNFKINWL